MEKSNGHITFLDTDWGVFELYRDINGNIWKALISNVFEHGYRIGRWEAPSHLADMYLANLNN